MYTSINEVFGAYTKHVKIDAALANRVINFTKRFLNKDESHVAFFGGVFIGVDRIRWHEDSDETRWFDTVLDIDDIKLGREIQSLKTFNGLNRKVSSNTFNLSVIWVIHKLMTSNLPKELKAKSIQYALVIIQAKILSSFLFRNFGKFDADPDVALATYNTLSKKFKIRNIRSWTEFLRNRADQLLENHKWLRAIERFNPDKDIVDFISDIHGGINSTIKLYTGVYHIILSNNKKITTIGAKVELDGVEHVRDVTQDTQKIREYILTCIRSEPDFIKDDLVSVFVNPTNANQFTTLRTALVGISKNFQHDKHVSEFVTESIQWGLSVISENRFALNSLVQILNTCRGLITAPRPATLDVVKLRDDSTKLVRLYCRTNSDVLVASTKTNVILYIILRALCMSKYSD